MSEGCFQGYDPFRFPEVYDSITQQDLLDFIRDNIRPERMACPSSIQRSDAMNENWKFSDIPYHRPDVEASRPGMTP